MNEEKALQTSFIRYDPPFRRKTGCIRNFTIVVQKSISPSCHLQPPEPCRSHFLPEMALPPRNPGSPGLPILPICSDGVRSEKDLFHREKNEGQGREQENEMKLFWKMWLICMVPCGDLYSHSFAEWLFTPVEKNVRIFNAHCKDTPRACYVKCLSYFHYLVLFIEDFANFLT